MQEYYFGAFMENCMDIFGNLNKTLSQGLDRARFEAERLQKTLRLQSEISELKRQIDAKRQELGERAFELYKAGQIQSPTLGTLVQSVDALRSQITLKEEELKQAQDEEYMDPPQASGQPPAASQAAPPPQPSADTRACPNCHFIMPRNARFCPQCGARVSA